MKRLLKSVALLGAAALALAGLQVASPANTIRTTQAATNPVAATLVDATSTTASVMIGDNFFSPTTTTVSLGTTVTWTNQGTMLHTVTADDGSFNSGDIAASSTYSHTFNTAGTYNYYCSHHGGPGLSGMSGTIIVTAAATTTTSGTSTPPTVPTNLTIGSTTPTSIALSWTNSTSASSTVAGYNVVRNGSTIASTTLTNFTDTGLTASTSYAYNVSAFDIAGNTSAWSNTATGTTASVTNTSTSTPTSSPPAAPLNLMVSSTSPTTVMLSWTAPTSSSSTVVGYNIIRNGTSVASTTLTTYTDIGLSNNTTYTYNVSSFDGSGNNSNWSNTVYATTAANNSTSTGTSTLPNLNFNGTIGWLVLPANLYNSWNSSTTASSTAGSPFTYINGYPTLNGNYYDCFGNIDNDMGHHTTNTSDNDPGHHSGQNCPGGSPQLPGGISMPGMTNGLPQNFMTNWFTMLNNNQQWVVIPLTSQTLQWLVNKVNLGVPSSQ